MSRHPYAESMPLDCDSGSSSRDSRSVSTADGWCRALPSRCHRDPGPSRLDTRAPRGPGPGLHPSSSSSGAVLRTGRASIQRVHGRPAHDRSRDDPWQGTELVRRQHGPEVHGGQPRQHEIGGTTVVEAYTSHREGSRATPGPRPRTTSQSASYRNTTLVHPTQPATKWGRRAPRPTMTSPNSWRAGIASRTLPWRAGFRRPRARSPYQPAPQSDHHRRSSADHHGATAPRRRTSRRTHAGAASHVGPCTEDAESHRPAQLHQPHLRAHHKPEPSSESSCTSPAAGTPASRSAAAGVPRREPRRARGV